MVTTKGIRIIDLQLLKTESSSFKKKKKSGRWFSNPLHGHKNPTDFKVCNCKATYSQHQLQDRRESILGCSQGPLPVKNEFWEMGRNVDKRGKEELEGRGDKILHNISAWAPANPSPPPHLQE